MCPILFIGTTKSLKLRKKKKKKKRLSRKLTSLTLIGRDIKFIKIM